MKQQLSSSGQPITLFLLQCFLPLEYWTLWPRWTMKVENASPFFPLCDSHNFNFSSKKNFRLFQILYFDKQLWSQVTAFRTLFLLFKHKNFIYSSHVKHHGSCVKFLAGERVIYHSDSVFLIDFFIRKLFLKVHHALLDENSELYKNHHFSTWNVPSTVIL